MFKIVLLLLSVFVLANASDYARSNAAAKEALKEIDCDFEDCQKAAPVVIIQEKVIIKEVPVEVEKIVTKEKIIYVDRPAEEEIVAAPVVEEKITPKATVEGRTYNRAFFDVHAPSQAPMLDYIKFTSRASFSIEHFVDTVNKIKEKNTKVYIHGQIAVPSTITTSQVYMNVGQKYRSGYYNYWKKEIYYNNSSTAQNADYFLVDVQSDSNGNRYVDYKIYIFLESPWKIVASEENYAPNTFFFKMAPKIRGFKDQFVKAEIYIAQE